MKKQKDNDIISLNVNNKGRDMGKLIAFCNQKGGVGKTTSCVNIAAFLAKSGYKVLIVDLDPQGNTTSGLGIDKSRPFSVYSIICKQVEITDRDVVSPTAIDNLYILPSNKGLEGAEVELAFIEKDKEKVILNELKKISDNYDFILMDCPPSLGLITINALAAANSVIVPIQCEFYALEGLAQLMNTIKIIRNFLNKNLEIEGVLLTMYDVRSKLSGQVADEIRRNFSAKMYKNMIPRNVRLAEAPSYGTPVMLYDSKCAGAKAY